MYFIPFIGSVSVAAITLMEKLVLRIRKVNIQTVNTYAFLASTLVMLPLMYFFWNVHSQALELKNILIFSLVIITSIAANLFAFYALKWEKITRIEPAKMLEPLFIVLLAIVFSFFSILYERNLNVIIPALIAGSALVFSHIRKHHLKFNKYFISATAASFLFATELILSRLILEFYNPISFYFLRCSAIFIISFIILKKGRKIPSSKAGKEIALIGFLWVVYRISVYYGYIFVGVVETTLILLLAPVLIYFFAWKYMKEKLNWKNILSAGIILGCVAYVVLI